MHTDQRGRAREHTGPQALVEHIYPLAVAERNDQEQRLVDTYQRVVVESNGPLSAAVHTDRLMEAVHIDQLLVAAVHIVDQRAVAVHICQQQQAVVHNDQQQLVVARNDQ